METTEAAWAEVAGAETENYTVVYMTRFIVELPWKFDHKFLEIKPGTICACHNIPSFKGQFPCSPNKLRYSYASQLDFFVGQSQK